MTTTAEIQKGIRFLDPLKVGLPANIDAERFVLGLMLLGAVSASDVETSLVPEDFMLEAHQRIYRKILELHHQGTEIDHATVSNAFMRSTELDSIGGVSFIVSLDDGLPFISNCDAYIRIVKEKSILRRTIFACSVVMNECLMASDNAASVLARGEKILSDLNGETAADQEFQTPAEIIEAAGGVDAYFKNRRVSGISTPWDDLNRMTRGLQPGHLAILAARTSKGKSAMAANIAVHASRCGKSVALFSLEMDRTEVNDRLLALAGGVSFADLRGNNRAMITQAVNATCQLPIHIRDMGGCTVPAVLSKVRRLQQQHDIELVIVDYLQLMSGVGKSENRTQEVSAISRGLKLAAQELRIPFLVLSQLRRALPHAPNAEPTLADLRESGSIEQDANLVCFIHAEQEYHLTSEGCPSPMKLIVAKQRNGPTGVIEMNFFRECGRFNQNGEVNI